MHLMVQYNRKHTASPMKYSHQEKRNLNPIKALDLMSCKQHGVLQEQVK